MNESKAKKKKKKMNNINRTVVHVVKKKLYRFVTIITIIKVY